MKRLQVREYDCEMLMELSGWGRYPRAVNTVLVPTKGEDAVPPSVGRMIARGQGRSYGDAAMLRDGSVLLCTRLSRLIQFDEKSGILVAEGGATIDQILRTFVPLGWFPSVTPGTKHVSLGGCIAADVHGKNHHRAGAFSEYVTEFELVTANRETVTCSRNENAELFWATVGGMGLTGIITKVSFRLRQIESAFMMVEHRAASDLDTSLEFLELDAFDDQYTVAWIDCFSSGRALGRSILMCGHHAALEELPRRTAIRPFELKRSRRLNVPFDLPSWVLNSFTATAFNSVYYHTQRARRGEFMSDYESFFYPLDKVDNWNRMYGRKGFIQYQFALPPNHAREGLLQVIEQLARSGRPSFLSVLKRFGPQSQGLLSFPITGYTLTLDIPIRDAGLFAFLDRLDEIVLKFDGRVYLAKDARLSPASFRAMYPRFAEWQRVKERFDSQNRFMSDLSQRLEMHCN